MGKATKSQINASPYFFKTSWLYFAVPVPSLVLTCFLLLGLSFYPITLLSLFLLTIYIITLSKKRAISAQNTTQEEVPKSLLDKEGGEKMNTGRDAVIHFNAAQQSEVSHMEDYRVESTEIPSDGESSDEFFASENFKLNWMQSDDVTKDVAIFECLTSDEDEEDDNLIEISLPNKDSAAMDEESEHKLQTNLPDYLAESIFTQQGLMELLEETEEVNEEDNLIEIDLSMGSIKASALEIEA